MAVINIDHMKVKIGNHWQGNLTSATWRLQPVRGVLGVRLRVRLVGFLFRHCHHCQGMKVFMKEMQVEDKEHLEAAVSSTSHQYLHELLQVIPFIF